MVSAATVLAASTAPVPRATHSPPAETSVWMWMSVSAAPASVAMVAVSTCPAPTHVSVTLASLSTQLLETAKTWTSVESCSTCVAMVNIIRS